MRRSGNGHGRVRSGEGAPLPRVAVQEADRGMACGTDLGGGRSRYASGNALAHEVPHGGRGRDAHLRGVVLTREQEPQTRVERHQTRPGATRDGSVPGQVPECGRPEGDHKPPPQVLERARTPDPQVVVPPVMLGVAGRRRCGGRSRPSGSVGRGDGLPRERLLDPRAERLQRTRSRSNEIQAISTHRQPKGH